MSAKVFKNNLIKALDLFQKALGCGGLFQKPLNRELLFPLRELNRSECQTLILTAHNIQKEHGGGNFFLFSSAVESPDSKTQKTPNIKVL